MKNNRLLIKFVNFVVKFRHIFLCLFIFLVIYCGLNNKSYDILNNKNNIINTEFNNINEIKLMITNINKDDSLNIINSIKSINYVKNIVTDYKDDNALLIIYLDNNTNIKDDIDNIVNEYDYYLYIDDYNEIDNNNMIIIVCIIVLTLLILLLTTHSYFDILLGIIIFGVSIIINMGFNISDANIIFIIVQLAIMLYYYLIFMNYYNKEIDDSRSKIIALKKTLSKVVTKILSSSLIMILVTIPLYFIKLNIGKDISILLIKTIICNMLIIILLFPSLLMLFNSIILRLRHRNIIINTTKLSDFIIQGRKILFIIFIIIFIISIFIISKYNYIYNNHSINIKNKNDNEIALNKINNTFGYINNVNIIVKNDNKDYNKELQMASKILHDKKILSVINIGNIKLDDNLYLGSNINYKEFSTFFNVDTDTSINIYNMFATEFDELIKLNDIDNYEISIIDLINYLKDQEFINDEIKNKINNYYDILNHYMEFLEQGNYSHFIIEYKGEIESKDTYNLLDTIKDDINKTYENVAIEGESINSKNLKSLFNQDKFKTSIITMIIILLIILYTSKSFGMTILLTIFNYGNVLISFSFITLINNKIFYISYILIKTLEIMFITNYSVYISNKYLELRKKYTNKNSLIKTINESLLPILLSNLVIILLCLIVGNITKSNIISITCNYLEISFSISTLLVIFIIPIILYTFDKFIKNTMLKK